MAVVSVAFVSAVYLVFDANRLERRIEVVEYFRRRALAAAVVTGVVAFAGIFVLKADAEYLFDGLTREGCRWCSPRPCAGSAPSSP